MQTKFELSEPNLASAKRKNVNGFCGMHNCNNTVNETQDAFVFGIKICSQCGEKRDEMCKNIQSETDAVRAGWLTECIDSFKKA